MINLVAGFFCFIASGVSLSSNFSTLWTLGLLSLGAINLLIGIHSIKRR